MADFLVTTLDDSSDPTDGLLSLREALALANGNGEADRIAFDAALAGGTLTLTAGALAITETVEIDGDAGTAGASRIAIDGSGLTRLFTVTATAANFEDLHLQDGYGGYNQGGGAIYAGSGSEVTIEASALSGNYGGYNGPGSAVLGRDSIIRLFETELWENTGNFGAVAVTGGTLTIVNSALFDNTSTTAGGAVYTSETNLYVAGSSFVANAASYGNGGAIYADGAARVVNSTFTGNEGTEGAAIYGSNLTLVNSVAAGNRGQSQIYGQSLAREGGNIIGAAVFDGETETGTADPAEIFAALSDGAGVLQELGGPVLGVRLLAQGPAVDAADPALLPLDLFDGDGDQNFAEIASTDANGQARIQGDGPDLGASELSAEAGSGAAQTLTVTTLEDETAGGIDAATEAADGAGLSLREALAIASAGDGPGIIQFDQSLAGGRIVLREGQLQGSGNITIDGDLDGNGTPDIALNARAMHRILDWQGGDLTIDGLAFENGAALQGAALRVDQGVLGSLTVENSRFVNNTVITEGYTSFGDRRGGAIHTHVATEIDASLFRNNSAGDFADSSGGAIFSSTDLTVTGSEFEGNTGGQIGGAIANFGGIVRIEGSSFDGNRASSGGAIGQEASFLAQNAVTSLDIQGGEFTGNTAGYGGAVFATETTQIDTSVFSNNIATTDYSGTEGGLGGAVAAIDAPDGSGEIAVTGSVFTGNRAVSTLEGVTSLGGGLYITGLTARVDGTEFRENDATYGGGAFLAASAGSGASVSNALFEGNTAAFGAGLALNINGDTGQVVNTSFVGNSASQAGGGFYAAGAAEVAQSTFTGNQADAEGGALFAATGSTFGQTGVITLINSLAIGNSSAAAGAILQNGNNILGGQIFEDGVATGPVFVAEVFADIDNGEGVLGENGGPLPTLALLAGGAAEDRGATGALPADTLDLDQDGDLAEALPLDARGELRLAGKAVDLGAFEVQREAPRGTAEADVIGGFENDETLVGGLGDDTIFGGGGDDVLIGGAGADRLNGGAGSDTASYAFAAQGVMADLDGLIQNTATAAGDTYVSVENLIGTEADDRLRGDGGSNRLDGLGGEDFLFGRGGDDSLFGGAGDDLIAGNAGQDRLTGGAGADHFVLFTEADSEIGLTRRDIVADFTQGEDRLDLSRLDGSFTFLGSDAFTGTAGELRFFTIAANGITVVQGDTTGDGVQDFQVELTGLLTLTGADLLL
ncbi:MAG: choice-of-anchor Q domain-containing protein [Pseudomonadota bacterium]